MGVGFDPVARVAGELAADHLQLVVEAGGADAVGDAGFAHLFNELAARGLRVAGLVRVITSAVIRVRWSSCERPISCGRRISPWLIGRPP